MGENKEKFEMIQNGKTQTKTKQNERNYKKTKQGTSKKTLQPLWGIIN